MPAVAESESAFVLQLGRQMRAPKLRTIGEFAESEITLPEGPYAGRRFRLDRAPVARLLFEELSSNRWQRVFVTGPNQDGKSLTAFVIPTIYTLFERNETVILGVPSMEMVADKWLVDLLPVIQQSRYRDQLPTSGRGSRSGESELIRFNNGTFLKFMTAGGGDQSRAGFTSTNLIVTETDGFDRVGGSSREGDKFSQLERRLLAHGSRARTLAECTVSYEQGRTWQEYLNGTHSRIAIPCQHCSEYVTPEREHLHGWQNAGSDKEAARLSRLHCPKCGVEWTNAERIASNRKAVLVHKGQSVDVSGAIVGDVPDTNTLGFRWTVVNSILNEERLSMVAAGEWRAKRAPDEDAAERDLCQREWVLPAKPAKVDLSQLDAFAIMRRTMKFGRGICPEDTQAITIGCDIGKRLAHWTAIAWRPNATPHILDYGRLEIPADQMGVEEAILIALRDWRDEMDAGAAWKCGDREIRPTFIFVDCGNWHSTILTFTTESGPPWFSAWGYGIGQRQEGQNKQTRESGSKLIWAKEGYGLIQKTDGQHYLEVKSDQWKSWLHERLKTPLDKSGALTLFNSNEHLSIAKHLTAEKQVERFTPAHGRVVIWEAISRNNHWLDSTMLACVAGYEAGMRLTPTPEPPAEPERPAKKKSSWVPETTNWLNQ